ncbi:sugar-binding protein [Fredinandcohnia sp. 179-A 10B2 NHS]|uniref:sugar-binding protein n=1 Tax=Fredinandcohnia sp. 179-A 10B2 NHS TaxID=3235176 RepID=UPI0039A2691B
MKKKTSLTAKTLAFTMMCSLLPFGTAFADSNKGPVDLDMLFIGAHPDDEAGGLSTYGQWIEEYDYDMGVMTITRGEGGGNAVGPEEGPDLGILREKEERDAVGLAGIENVFNLDKVDFYYNVSAPLTEQVWSHDSTLEKVVRTIRMTKPEVIFTMNPSPTPGNHGHHQYAARMAVEAFYAAADPNVFPEQLTKEGLEPWSVKKIAYRGASGTAGANGNGLVCERSFVPTEPTDKVYSVWSGKVSEKHNKTWGQLERDSQRMYVSQGWGGFGDVPADPNALGCDTFTEIDTRVPTLKDNTSSIALLEGALYSEENGIPLGVELFVTTSDYEISVGETFTMAVDVTNNSNKNLKGVNILPELPEGWAVKDTKETNIEKIGKGESKTIEFQVTAPTNLETKRYRLHAQMSIDSKVGYSSKVVEGVSDVEANLQPLSHVKQFQEWAVEHSVQNLESLIKPVFSMGTGETKTIQIEVENNSNLAKTGEVSLQLPAGFASDEATKTVSLEPNEMKAVQFIVVNTDPSLKTSNEGGSSGDYNFTITTKVDGKEKAATAGINLVPVTTISQAANAPTVDGDAHDHEYGQDEIDLSRVWEGTNPSSAADGSGSAKVSWHDEALYFYVHVQDDILGTVLEESDAKRHWRTDSVEITIDPQGGSENTSSTFKVGIFPTTTSGTPAAYRDADNFQGPIEDTAPGMEIASTLDLENYSGYTIEAKIPFSALPTEIDPEKLAFNIFIYDSDTQDKTGQTRLGWSTFRGVQGDPYRWGRGYVDGYEPTGNPAEPKEAIIPTDVTQSVLSPQSILQSSVNGVPLASGVAADKNSLQIVGQPKLTSNGVAVKLNAKTTGKANVFVWSNNRIVDSKTVNLQAKQQSEVVLDYPSAEQGENSYLLISYETHDGKTKAFSYSLRK